MKKLIYALPIIALLSCGPSKEEVALKRSQDSAYQVEMINMAKNFADSLLVATNKNLENYTDSLNKVDLENQNLK